MTVTIPVGSFPYRVAADPAAGTVYVANAIDDTVSVIGAVRVPTALTERIGLRPHLISAVTP